MKAYILANSEPDMIWKVAEAALNIECIRETYAVTGQFDNIIQVEFEKMEDLGRIIEKVQSIRGHQNPDPNCNSTSNQRIAGTNKSLCLK